MLRTVGSEDSLAFGACAQGGIPTRRALSMELGTSGDPLGCETAVLPHFFQSQAYHVTPTTFRCHPTALV